MRRGIVAGLVVSILAAAPAGAATFCVNLPATCTQANEFANLTDALAAAVSQGGDDTIELGQGTFSAPTTAGFDAATGGNVLLRGRGAAVTTVTAAALADGEPVLDLPGGDSGGVQDLRVVIPGGSALFLTGIEITGGTTEDVEITLASSTAAYRSGIYLVSNGGLVRRAVIDLSGSTHTGSIGADIDGASSGGTGDGLQIVAPVGVQLRTGAVVRRSRIRASVRGIVFGEGTSRAEDNTIRLTANGADGVFAGTSGSDIAANLDRTTISGEGRSGTYGVRVWAISASDATAADLDGVAITGVTTPLDLYRDTIGAVASATVNHSAFDQSAVVAPGGGVTYGTGNLNLTPTLVDAAGGDLRPPDGSPLIDAGDPAYTVSGSLDAAGSPRLLDGDGNGVARVDIGGLEHPVAPLTGGETFYASQTGTGTCLTAAAPCSLLSAVGRSFNGDTVQIASGTYADASVQLKPGVTFQGAAKGAARPLLTSATTTVYASNAGAANAALRDLRIESTGSSPPVSLGSVGASGLQVERSSLRQLNTQSAYNGLDVVCTSGAVTIRDSEITSVKGIAAALDTPSGACTWNLRNDVFSSAEHTALGFHGGTNPSTAAAVTATVRNSVVLGPAVNTSFASGTTFNVSIDHSRIGTLNGPTNGGDNITADPVFVNTAGGDFHQLRSSPTRDAGVSDLLTSLLDIDGHVRPLGVAYDMGADEYVPVPPSATTGDATAITTSGATLTGTVDPRGLETTYIFDHGPDTNYGSQTASASAGSGSGAAAVSRPISAAEGATVHYRLRASNGDGTATGDDRTVIIIHGDPIATPTRTPTPTSTPSASPTAAPTASPGATRRPASLSVAGSPRRDRRPPYKFTVKGKLTPPAGLKDCSGRVVVRFKKGARTISSRSASLKTGCTYSVRVTLATRLARRATLRIQVTFEGNAVLLPRRSKIVTVRTT